MTKIILLTSILLAAFTFPLAGAEAEPTPTSFHFVSFELGDIIAKQAINGALHATFADQAGEAAFNAGSRTAIQVSLSLPASTTDGAWNVTLEALDGAPLLQAHGMLTADGIQILGSRVDTTRIELPRDTTSLRVTKGYVSAAITLAAELKQAGCCTASLGVDADADGNITPAETRSAPSAGASIQARITLERAAPTVPYVFSISNADGKVVARASGTYSFTKLNGVSAQGEFDPEHVLYVTGNVEREPHLVQHDIGSSILLQTVAGAARQEEGPKVFFSMGTPGARAGDPAATASTFPAATAEPSEAAVGPSFGHRVLSFLTGTVFLAILGGSFLAALLAFAARRLLERAH